MFIDWHTGYLPAAISGSLDLFAQTLSDMVRSSPDTGHEALPNRDGKSPNGKHIDSNGHRN